jgi:PTS system mannose-specific IIC component
LFTATQIILILLVNTVFSLFNLGMFVFFGATLVSAVLTGLVMGDMQAALYVGGTLLLMGIGLNPLGGSSVPNYTIGAVVGTAYAAALHDNSLGLSIGLVIGTLSTQLDVFRKMWSVFFLHMGKNAIDKKEFKKGYRWIFSEVIPNVLLAFVFPVILCLILGQVGADKVLGSFPQWLLNGLRNAGGILPGMGFALLLLTLPIRQNFMYLLIGFFLMAYLKVPVLGIAIFGVALAWIDYNNNKKILAASSSGANNSNGGTINGDE